VHTEDARTHKSYESVGESLELCALQILEGSGWTDQGFGGGSGLGLGIPG
jgi:hypothetical protein